jgi:hypothetical protein
MAVRGLVGSGEGGVQHKRAWSAALLPLVFLVAIGGAARAAGSPSPAASVTPPGEAAGTPSPPAARDESATPTPPADVTPPVTTVAGAVAGAWYNAPLTLIFRAADNEGGSGVAALVIVLDSVSQTFDAASAQLVIPAPADHSGDGQHTVLYHAVDAAGNVEAENTLIVGIDTRPPTTTAPVAASVAQYSAAALQYEVLDVAPNGGTAAVTISLKSTQGNVVQTLRYASQPVNALLVARFTCSLAPGGYVFTVTAADAAGNPQATAGSNRLTVKTAWSSGLPFRFRITGLTLRDISPSAYPLRASPLRMPKVDTGPHDAFGVRMFWYGGRLYDHVVAQATFGAQNLNVYMFTRDPFYLRRAQAQAQRLISRRRVVGAAWFLPYGFPWAGVSPPWYSGMGQGLAMALFQRLYDATHNTVYQQAAKATFLSFLRLGPSSSPWVVNVDKQGYLWLQEYPAAGPDYTLNGHIFAAFALHDYYTSTHDRRALELFNGAITTVLHYARSFRQPNWISFYCLAHHASAGERYHKIHLNQFLGLYRLTGITAFARLADDFQADYPETAVSGAIKVMPGIYTGIRFGASGQVLAQRTVRVTQALRLPVTFRGRVRFVSGYWFRTTSGPWAGMLLHEQAGRVFLPGVVRPLSYDPPRALLLPAGHVYVGHRYDANGAVTGSASLTADAATTAPVSRRAFVNGVDQVLIAGGPLQGYWLPLMPAALK